MTRVSVVINTLNRADSLRVTLHALRYLDYEDFEVIVVNGPSTDHTEEVLAEHTGQIKVAVCPEANLSQSRNIGIALAAGDIVAFLDDDAYPDPAWLDHIVGGYADEEVAAVGGPVLDHTGVAYQVRYLRSDRYGSTSRDAEAGENPSYALSVPGATHFPSLLGANSSFRRDLLVAGGGFDEEFEYYLDETDVCVRLVDAGYVVRMLEDGFVYHKFLPSSIRRADRIARNRYSVVKNSVYFALRHANRTQSFADVCDGIAKVVGHHRAEMRDLFNAGLIARSEHEQFELDVERGSDAAFEHAARPPRTRPAAYFCDPPAFLRYPRNMPARRMHIALITREHPPNPVNGIGRLFASEAKALAMLGHVVRIVTEADSHDTVDFEDGVWVHRYTPRPGGSLSDQLPAHAASWATTARTVVDAIHARRPLDVVIAPSWDSEGLGMLDDRPCPFVLGVYTPLPTVISLDERLASGDPAALARLLAAERRCVEEADFVLASGPWTIEEIERGHGVEVSEHRRLYAPHGLADLSGGVVPERPAEAGTHLLFVGRLEPRKGIDVLMACLPSLLAAFPDLVVTLAGDDVHGIGPAFLASLEPEVARRVLIVGRVDDERLVSLYAGCDVFVAPSRYESFGLILLEAMMFAKPVVASRVGGMASIVDDGVTGHLVEPGDVDALGQALGQLLGSPEARARMGLAGRERYDAEYTEARMAAVLQDALVTATASPVQA